ncbi:MAG: IS110 family transposase [Rhodospirillales bacterium]|jgi:transposase
MTCRTIGIDLAIRGDHVAQFFEDGRPAGRPLRFRFDDTSLDTFVARATADLRDGDTVQALMEPTGMSWFPVAHRLRDAGVEVVRIKGTRVKALRRYLSEHAKTDLADAHVLAAMPSFGGPRLDPVHVPSPKGHALQRLTKQRGRLQDEVADAKRRLTDLVRWASPTLERVLPDLRTRLALAMLREWLDPDRVLRARRTTIARSVADNANGNQPHSGPFVDALVVGLRAAAAHARALHRGHVDFAELQAEVAVEIDLMTSRIDALAGLERRIEALYAELHPADLLRTIPGIGQHIAPVIAGILHDPKRFRSERHLRGFCGLFPKRADSGGVERPGQRIAQGGNDRIKRALVLAADAARRTDPQLAETYWRLMTTKGHHHKQALCAVANRLVNRIRSVLLSQRPYVLRDLDGTEITVAQARAIIAQRYTVPTVVRASRRATRSAPPT